MNKLPNILIFIFCIITSCSQNHKEYSINFIGEPNPIFGHTNSLHNIGDEFQLNNLDTSEINIQLEQNKLISVTIYGQSKFELSNGVGIGYNKNEIIKIMGKPTNDRITVNKGDFELIRIDALLYNNLTIWLDEQSNANAITLGEPEPVRFH